VSDQAQSPVPRFAHSRRLRGDGGPARTLRVLKVLAKRYPDDPAIWLELSHASRARGDPDALTYARQADRLAPANVQVLRALALALATEPAGLDEALQVIKRALVLRGADPGNWSVLALIRLDRGEPIEAALACERALALDPSCVDAHLVLGDIALSYRAWDDATKRFRRAQQLRGDASAAAEALAWLEQRRDGSRAGWATPAGSTNGTAGASAWWSAPAAASADGVGATRTNGQGSHVVDAIDRHIDAYNRRDITALAEGFAPDATLRTDGRDVVGRDNIVTIFAATFASQVRSTLHVTNVVIQHDTASCELTETWETPTARENRELVAIFTVEGDRIARARVLREQAAPSAPDTAPR
jgi:uncharacterized protein (TIGR02246 family)